MTLPFTGSDAKIAANENEAIERGSIVNLFIHNNK